MTKLPKPKQHMSNALWYIEKARSYVLDGDPCAAKSWLLTAKTLYPGEFSIQYEEFVMERKAGQKQKCAKLFYDMILTFSKEELLWDELARMFYAQDATRAQTIETKFLKEMFDSLPENHQKELLLKYANNQSDLVDKCRISLLVLKRFKGAARDQAVSLITTLQTAEENEYPNNVLNMYRKIIVCDILPIILKNPETQVLQEKSKSKNKGSTLYLSEEQLLNYLNLVMEFLVSLAINKCSFSTSSGVAQSAKTDLLLMEFDESATATSSWHLLHENLLLFANKLNWNNVLKFKDKVDPAKNRPLKSRWKTLNNARDTKPQIGLFYAVLQLHLYCVLEYCSTMSSLSSKVTSPHQDHHHHHQEQEFVLVENIDHMTQKDVVAHQGVIRAPKKKRKSDDSGNASSDYTSASEDVTVIVHPGLIGRVSEGLGEYLQVAIETHNFLKSSFNEEFIDVRDEWKINGWQWMKTFDIDSLLYQGKHRSSIEKISSSSPQGISEEMNFISLKNSLQLSSSFFCSGQRKLGCEEALRTVAMLSPAVFELTNQIEDKKFGKPEGRSLLVLSSCPSDVLTYAVQIIFAALKLRMYCDDPHRDWIIGHLVVLSQLMWTKNEDFFLHLLKLIQAQDGGFKYPLFFTYVTQIDIIEEFAFLHANKTIPLELALNEDSSAKKTITRGVNREVRDDFKSSVMRQVGRSHEPIKNIIYSFLTKEKESILEVL